MSSPEKLFIVSVGTGSNKEQRNAFTEELRADKSIGFWHHVEYTWLIHDIYGKHTAVEYRDRAKELMPDATNIVVQAKPQDYAGFVPEPSHSWLADYVSGGRYN